MKLARSPIFQTAVFSDSLTTRGQTPDLNINKTKHGNRYERMTYNRIRKAIIRSQHWYKADNNVNITRLACSERGTRLCTECHLTQWKTNDAKNNIQSCNANQ